MSKKTSRIRIALHHVRSCRIWKSAAMLMADARSRPCRREILKIRPSSHVWMGRAFQSKDRSKVAVLLLARKRLARNAGMAWWGVKIGLIRKRTVRKDATETREATKRANRREGIG